MNMMGPPGGGFPMGGPMHPHGGTGDWGMMPPMPSDGGDFFRGGPPMGMGPMGSNAQQHMMEMARGNMPPHGRNSRMRNMAPRIPCKYFMTSTCRFGSSCSFLHPGINGPMLQ